MEALHEELRNIKALLLETLIIIPINKIKITVSKPNLLNTNTKLVIVTQPVSIMSLIPTIKSKMLPNPLMFNKN